MGAGLKEQREDKAGTQAILMMGIGILLRLTSHSFALLNNPVMDIFVSDSPPTFLLCLCLQEIPGSRITGPRGMNIFQALGTYFFVSV